MGAACSSEPGDAQSRAIDKQLAKDEQMQREVKKLLLLGAGECGKSTMIKQVRMAHDDQWKLENKDVERYRIYSNVVRGMVDLLNGVEQLHMVLPKEMADHSEVVKGVLKEKKDMDRPSEETVAALKALWSDEIVKKAYEQRNQLQVVDSVAYFLDSIDRIAAAGYVPSNDDYLHIRIPTTGAVEYKITIKDAPFTFIDVGGQRAERRKWEHHFDNITSVIFISAISEFDQMANENDKLNRLDDSMGIYCQLINESILKDKPFILFLNKTDLFREKIEVQGKSLKVLFRNYKYPNTYEDSLQYLERKFLTMRKEKRPYMHRTCATDTDQVQKVISSVIDAILTDTLMRMGMDMS